jgi:hypothetical protein
MIWPLVRFRPDDYVNGFGGARQAFNLTTLNLPPTAAGPGTNRSGADLAPSGVPGR